MSIAPEMEKEKTRRSDSASPASATRGRTLPAPGVVHRFRCALRVLFGGPEEHNAVIHHDKGIAYEDRWRVRVSVTADELDGGYVAKAVDLPGCISEGETEEEAIANLQDAIGGVIAARMQAHVDAHEYTATTNPDGSVDLEILV